jgi:predicted transcriptional regulator
MRKTNVSFSIESETLLKLAELAKKLDLSKSKIVNDLIVSLLTETDKTKIENLLKKAIAKLE